MDMDARVTHPVTDPNGQTCALIKVETTQTGFRRNQRAKGWTAMQEACNRTTVVHPFSFIASGGTA